MLLGHLRDIAAKQAQLKLEIENHLWANDLAGMGYSEADIASKAQAVFSHLFAMAEAEPRALH